MGDILLLGHRGAAELPENTIPSFHKALELGADGFELDVLQTADEKLVVIHDAVVGTKNVHMSSYQEIRDLPDGFKIPLLEEVLMEFSKSAFLDIELKTRDLENTVIELILKYCAPQKTLLSAYWPDVLSKAYTLAPEIELAFIYNRTQDEESRHNCPVDVLKPQFRLASRELMEQAHDEGLRVIPWTVNEKSEMQRLINLGVDGMISDHPEYFPRELDSSE